MALNHKEIASIMAVTGTILPKQYFNVITRHEQKKKILSHATSVGNKRKQTEDRKTFLISNIVSGNYIGIFFWFVLVNYIGILSFQNGAGQRHNGCNFFMIQCNGQ